MAASLKGVIIGSGYFAGFQAEAWQRVAGAQITAVADLVPERAQAFAARYGIARVYTDAADMLAKERPDFVDLATRPESHRILALMAADAGAHVICQKPLTPTWDDSVAMVREVSARGVRLIVHENWRWQPWYRAARALLDQGVVGRPYFLGFHMRTGDGRGPAPYATQPYFRDMPRLLVYETLVHFLDTSRYLAGEIARISCTMARVNPVIQGEDVAIIQIGFANGTQGLIDANRVGGPAVAPVAFGELRIEGDRGTLRVTPDGHIFLSDPGGAERAVEFPTTDLGYRGDSVRAVQAHIVECLIKGQPAESEADDYLRTTAAVFACYQSAETGRSVSPATVETT